MQLRMRGHLDPINLLICHTQLMEMVGGEGVGAECSWDSVRWKQSEDYRDVFICCRKL